jgi:hypothetical protein
MRNILKVNKYARTKFMLEALRLQSVQQRIAFNVLKIIYKMEKGIMPLYLTMLLKKITQDIIIIQEEKVDMKHFTSQRIIHRIQCFIKELDYIINVRQYLIKKIF